MSYEHDNKKPEVMTEDWEGQFSIFSWMAYVSAIPSVIFIVTTLKDSGTPNAALQAWSSFTGEGDYFYVIMSGVQKNSHTYHNIKRDREFCINFLSAEYVDNCRQSILNNGDNTDEIAGSSLTPEESASIRSPRIKESFLKLECEFEWEKELCPDSLNVTICGRVKYISADEDFVKNDLAHRYGKDSFVFNLMAMKEPFTGKRIPGGIGRIEVTREMEL